MASGIIDLGSTRGVLEGRIVWESSSNGVSANSSYVAGHLQVRRNDGYTTRGTWTGALNIGGDVREFSNASETVGSDWNTMIEFYINQGHNADGTGSCYIEGYCNGPSGTSMAGHSVSGSAWIGLETIPRYAEIQDFHVESVGLDSVKLYYRVSRTAHIYCSVDEQAWGNPRVTNTSSGSFTVSNLTPNVKHSFAILVRSADSGLDRVSGTIYATTQDIGKITSLDNFEHGSNTNINITNPSGSELNLVIKVDEEQVLSKAISTGNNEISFNDNELDKIYKKYGSSNELTATFVLTTANKYTDTKSCKILLKRKSKDRTCRSKRQYQKNKSIYRSKWQY